MLYILITFTCAAALSDLLQHLCREEINHLSLNYRHTMNWIDFEVGLSLAWNKPVWIFEPLERRINFAVPYATHHIYYDYQSEDHVKWLVNILKEGIFNFNLDGRNFTCGNCKLTFTQLNDNMNEFSCPSCRMNLSIS